MKVHGAVHNIINYHLLLVSQGTQMAQKIRQSSSRGHGLSERDGAQEFFSMLFMAAAITSLSTFKTPNLQIFRVMRPHKPISKVEKYSVSVHDMYISLGMYVLHGNLMFLIASM